MVKELKSEVSERYKDDVQAMQNIQDRVANGRIVPRVIAKAEEEFIWDLYTRGVRVYEIARMKGLKEETVAGVIKRHINKLKRKLEKIKQNPEEELVLLAETFDTIARLAFQQYSAQASGVVKERFLGTALKSVLCKIKLLVDAGFLNVNLGEIFAQDKTKVEEVLPEETKEKLKVILEKIKNNKIIDVK